MNLRGRDFNGGGMVLFELIIALTVFALVAFSLVMALDAAMTAGGERNEIATVINGLANQMARLHEGPISPCDQDIPGDEPGIAYHLVIAPEQLKDQKGQPVPNIYRATITAKWKSGGQAEDRSIDELIYQP
jgi:hypothetical protein